MPLAISDRQVSYVLISLYARLLWARTEFCMKNTVFEERHDLELQKWQLDAGQPSVQHVPAFLAPLTARPIGVYS
jgi:hypothetical protein